DLHHHLLVPVLGGGRGCGGGRGWWIGRFYRTVSRNYSSPRFGTVVPPGRLTGRNYSSPRSTRPAGTRVPPAGAPGSGPGGPPLTAGAFHRQVPHYRSAVGWQVHHDPLVAAADQPEFLQRLEVLTHGPVGLAGVVGQHRLAREGSTSVLVGVVGNPDHGGDHVR